MRPDFCAPPNTCAMRCTWTPVFIAGPGEDLSAFREYRTIVGAPLGEIKSLLSGRSLFFGNDSGPAHMAAAFGIPVVAIFGSSDPAIWHPWRTASTVIQTPPGIAIGRRWNRCWTRWNACGYTHERTAAAAGVCQAVLGYLFFPSC